MDLVDRVLDAVLIVTTILAILAIILLIILLVIEIGDSIWSTEPETGAGVVASREFVPAHTTFILAGKILIPMRHPDAWYVTVRPSGGDETVKVGVEEGFFNAVAAGETRVEFDFTRGQLTGRITIERIWIADR